MGRSDGDDPAANAGGAEGVGAGYPGDWSVALTDVAFEETFVTGEDGAGPRIAGDF